MGSNSILIEYWSWYIVISSCRQDLNYGTEEGFEKIMFHSPKCTLGCIFVKSLAKEQTEPHFPPEPVCSFLKLKQLYSCSTVFAPLWKLIHYRLKQTTASRGQEERMLTCHQSCERTVTRPEPCKNLEDLHERSFPSYKWPTSQSRTKSLNHSCPRFSRVSFSKLAHSITHVTWSLSDQWTVCKLFVRDNQVLCELHFAYQY